MTTRYVNTASSAGGDGTTNNTSGATRAFATLLEAINSLPASLSDAYTIYCSGSAADTSAISQTPFDMTTSASNYLLIIGEQSPNHPTSTPTGVYDTGLYRLEITNNNALYNNLPAHFRIEGIQVQVTVSNGSSYVAIKTANANITAGDADFRVGYCIVKGVVTSGSLIGFESRPLGGGGAGTSKFYNCLSINCSTGYNGEFATTEMYNCTSISNGGVSFLSNAANGAKCVNCLASGSASPQHFLDGGAFATGTNYNASTDSSAPGANSRNSQTFTFLDSASGNYRLSLSDAGARDFGTSDPGSGLYSDDAVGHTRSGSWDIGFSEAFAVVALTGTATASITEADVVAGGKTIILTVDGDQWVPTNGTPTFNSGTTKGTTAADGRDGDGALTINWPSGYTPVAGHFALAIVYLDQGDASTPTGWSEVTGSPFGSGTEKLCIFYKVLAGGESAPSTTISGSASLASICANMAIYTGVGSIGAIGTGNQGTGTPMSATGVTTTDSNSIVVFICGRGDNENSSGQTFGGSSTGVTETLDAGTSQGNNSQISMADKTFASSSSASGDGSATTSVTDPWVAVMLELKRSTPFASARQAIINGLDSAQSEGTGWDAVVKAGQGVSGVVRTSNSVVTITLDAFGSYNITAQETITATVPTTALLGATSVGATPTFTVDAAAGGTPRRRVIVVGAMAPLLMLYAPGVIKRREALKRLIGALLP